MEATTADLANLGSAARARIRSTMANMPADWRVDAVTEERRFEGAAYALSVVDAGGAPVAELGIWIGREELAEHTIGG